MKYNKILTALGFACATDLSKNKLLSKRLIQVSALTLSCLVSISSFAQCGRGDQTDCKEDIGGIVVIGQPIDPIDWGNPFQGDPNGCDYLGDPDCDNENGGGDGSGSSGDPENQYDAEECYQLSALSPNVPGAPLVCATDPGDSLTVNYDTFITDYLGSILGSLEEPCLYRRLLSMVIRIPLYDRTVSKASCQFIWRCIF